MPTRSGSASTCIRSAGSSSPPNRAASSTWRRSRSPRRRPSSEPAVADAPAWLREAFKDGIDEREMVYRDGVERSRKKARPYAGANPWCWLAQFDSRQLPCAGQPGKFIERFHFIPRQRVETVLADRLRFALIRDNLGVDLPLEPGEARD